MNLSVSSLQETSALILGGGAFSPFSRTCIRWKYLCPAQNDASLILNYAKKEDKEYFYSNNRLYVADIEEDTLSPVLPNKKLFLKGFHQVMAFFKTSHHTINAMLESNFVRSGFVRVAPLDTAKFSELEINVFAELMSIAGYKTLSE